MTTPAQPWPPALAPTISDKGTADGDDPDHARLKILRAADAFDRRDHVMTAAAYQLHVMAIASSAARDHPGFVPARYLASLAGPNLRRPGVDPAILAAELCTVGLWRRTEGGYRVLDWPAVQLCIDHVRELRAVDKREAQAGALERYVDEQLDRIPELAARSAQPARRRWTNGTPDPDQRLPGEDARTRGTDASRSA